MMVRAKHWSVVSAEQVDCSDGIFNVLYFGIFLAFIYLYTHVVFVRYRFDYSVL